MKIATDTEQNVFKGKDWGLLIEYWPELAYDGAYVDQGRGYEVSLGPEYFDYDDYRIAGSCGYGNDDKRASREEAINKLESLLTEVQLALAAIRSYKEPE